MNEDPEQANANTNANGIPRVGALDPRAVIEFLDQMGTLAGEPEDVCLAYLQEAGGNLAQALLRVWADKSENLPRLPATNLPLRQPTVERHAALRGAIDARGAASKAAEAAEAKHHAGRGSVTGPGEGKTQLKLRTLSRRIGRSVCFLMLREGRGMKVLRAQHRDDGEDGGGGGGSSSSASKDDSSLSRRRLLSSYWKVRLSVCSTDGIATSQVLESGHSSQSANPQWGECFAVQLASTSSTVLKAELVTQAGEVLGRGSANVDPHIAAKHGGTVIREISIKLSRGRARGTLHLLLKRHVLEPLLLPTKKGPASATTTTTTTRSRLSTARGSHSPNSRGTGLLHSASAPVDEASVHLQADYLQDRSVSMDHQQQQDAAATGAHTIVPRRRARNFLRQASAGAAHSQAAVSSLSNGMFKLARFHERVASWVGGGIPATPSAGQGLRMPSGAPLHRAGFERVKLLIMLPRSDVDDDEIRYLLAVTPDYKERWREKLNVVATLSAGKTGVAATSSARDADAPAPNVWKPLFRCVLCKRDNPDETDAALAAQAEADARAEAKRNLPYGGDMMAAMRAGDRAAIRAIMSAKNAKPKKKRVTSEQASHGNRLPCNHRFCVSCLIGSSTAASGTYDASYCECADTRSGDEGALLSEMSLSLNERDMGKLLSKESFETLMTVSIQNVVDHDPSFVRCPNVSCAMPLERGAVLSVADAESQPLPPGTVGPGGRPLTVTEAVHFNQCRQRCPSCATAFCTQCGAIPYHIGFSCEEFALARPQQCRYCSVPLVQADKPTSTTPPVEAASGGVGQVGAEKKKEEVVAAKAEEQDHGEWKCVVASGVAYRNSMVLSNKYRGCRGPEVGEVVDALWISQDHKWIRVKASDGSGEKYLPVVKNAEVFFNKQKGKAVVPREADGGEKKQSDASAGNLAPELWADDYTYLSLAGRSEIVSIPWEKSKVTTKTRGSGRGILTNDSGNTSWEGLTVECWIRAQDHRHAFTNPLTAPKTGPLVRWGNRQSDSKFQLSIVNGHLIAELNVSAPKQELFSFFRKTAACDRARASSAEQEATTSAASEEAAAASVQAFLEKECVLVKIQFIQGSANLAADFTACSKTCLFDGAGQVQKWGKCKGAFGRQFRHGWSRKHSYGSGTSLCRDRMTGSGGGSNNCINDSNVGTDKLKMGLVHLMPTRKREPGLKYAIQITTPNGVFADMKNRAIRYKVTVAIGDPCYPSGRALQINGREIVEAGKNNDVMLEKGEFLQVSCVVDMSHAGSGGLIVLSGDDGHASREFEMKAVKKSATRVRWIKITEIMSSVEDGNLVTAYEHDLGSGGGESKSSVSSLSSLHASSMGTRTIVSSNDVTKKLFAQPAAAGGPPGRNEWHHVAATWDAESSLLRTFLDGAELRNKGRFCPFGPAEDGITAPVPGESVTLIMGGSEASALGLWEGVPSTKLSFSKGNHHVVHEVRGNFFAPEQYKSLWCPWRCCEGYEDADAMAEAFFDHPYAGVGCGPKCQRAHGGDGDCLRCGKPWGGHSGHKCRGDAGRGSWPLNAKEKESYDRIMQREAQAKGAADGMPLVPKCVILPPTERLGTHDRIDLGWSLSGGKFAGFMTEFRIWNCARSDWEIERDRHVRKLGPEPGLAGCWSLCGSNDNVVVDASSGPSSGNEADANNTACEKCGEKVSSAGSSEDRLRLQCAKCGHFNERPMPVLTFSDKSVGGHDGVCARAAEYRVVDHGHLGPYALSDLSSSARAAAANQSSSMLCWSDHAQQWSSAAGKGRCAIDSSARIVSPGYVTSWILNDVVDPAALEATCMNYAVPDGEVWFCVWRPCDNDGLAMPYDPANPQVNDVVTNYKLVGYNKATPEFVQEANTPRGAQRPGAVIFCIENQEHQIWCEAGDVIGWACKDKMPGALVVESINASRLGNNVESTKTILTTSASKHHGIYSPGTMRSFDRTQKIRYYLDATVRVSLGSVLTDTMAAKPPKPKRFKLTTSAPAWNVRAAPSMQADVVGKRRNGDIAFIDDVVDLGEGEEHRFWLENADSDAYPGMYVLRDSNHTPGTGWKLMPDQGADPSHDGAGAAAAAAAAAAFSPDKSPAKSGSGDAEKGASSPPEGGTTNENASLSRTDRLDSPASHVLAQRRNHEMFWASAGLESPLPIRADAKEALEARVQARLLRMNSMNAYNKKLSDCQARATKAKKDFDWEKKAVQLVSMTNMPFAVVWDAIVKNEGNPDATAMFLLDPPKPKVKVQEKKNEVRIASANGPADAKFEQKPIGKEKQPAGRSAAQCKKGDAVQVEYQGTWYDAVVLKRKPEAEGFFCHYKGWGKEYDEWVPVSRLRWQDRSPMHPIKLKPWQLDPNDKSAVLFSVVGAGVAKFNGDYVCDWKSEGGKKNGQYKFRKKGHATASCNFSFNTWYICDNYGGSFYSAQHDPEDGGRPPCHGWRKGMKGENPLPRIVYKEVFCEADAVVGALGHIIEDRDDSIPDFHSGHYQCDKHHICQLEGVGKMADARGRCRQLSAGPHHPRGGCGCLICTEDDHHWTCCGKSYLSVGCTKGVDLVGAQATVMNAGKQYTTSGPLALQLGVADRWKQHNHCMGGDKCVIVAQCLHKSRSQPCVAVQLDHKPDVIVLIGLVGLKIEKLAAKVAPPAVAAVAAVQPPVPEEKQERKEAPKPMLEPEPEPEPEPVEPEPEPEPEPVEWACGVCTFLNKPLHLSCSMCSSKRPEGGFAEASPHHAGSKAGEDGQDSGEAKQPDTPMQKMERLGLGREDGWSFVEWDCPRCTFHNQMDALSCLTCNEGRPIEGGATPKGKALASILEELAETEKKMRTMLSLDSNALQYDRDPSNEIGIARSILAIKGVCNKEECCQKRINACPQILSCGHPCGGVKGEHMATIVYDDGDDVDMSSSVVSRCLPCLTCDLGCSEVAECAFCSEPLSSAPAIKLDSCGHLFHYECCLKFIKQKWANSWPKISFGFMDCILCKRKMKHRMLNFVLRPLENMRKEVVKMSLAQLDSDCGNLKIEAKVVAWCGGGESGEGGYLKEDDVRFGWGGESKGGESKAGESKAGEIKVQSKAGPETSIIKNLPLNDRIAFSLHNYNFYECYRCERPYFAGKYVCAPSTWEVRVSSESDPEELWIRFDPDVRGGCGDVSQAIEEHYRDVLENVPGISPQIQVGYFEPGKAPKKALLNNAAHPGPAAAVAVVPAGEPCVDGAVFIISGAVGDSYEKYNGAFYQTDQIKEGLPRFRKINHQSVTCNFWNGHWYLAENFAGCVFKIPDSVDEAKARGKPPEGNGQGERGSITCSYPVVAGDLAPPYVPAVYKWSTKGNSLIRLNPTVRLGEKAEEEWFESGGTWKPWSEGGMDDIRGKFMELPLATIAQINVSISSPDAPPLPVPEGQNRPGATVRFAFNSTDPIEHLWWTPKKFTGLRHSFKKDDACEIIKVSADSMFFAPKDHPSDWAPFTATVGGNHAKLAWDKTHYAADMVYKCSDPNGVAYRNSRVFKDRYEPGGIFARNYAIFVPLQLEGAWMLVQEPSAGCGPKWLPLIKEGRVLFEKGRQPERGMFIRESAYQAERARALENVGGEAKDAGGGGERKAKEKEEGDEEEEVKEEGGKEGEEDMVGLKCLVDVVDMVCSGHFNGPIRRLDSEEAKEADAMALKKKTDASSKEEEGDGGVEGKDAEAAGPGEDPPALAAAPAAAAAVDPEELVCGRCSVANVQSCDKHGTEFIGFKCRFCCRMATFFCWQKVHFCSNCHSKIWQDLVEYQKGINKLKPPTGKFLEAAYDHAKIKDYDEYLTCPAQLSGNPKDCPLGILHANTGEEVGSSFLLLF